jgi:hypothetical protein
MSTPGPAGHWVSLGERAWQIETIWEAARGLAVEQVAIETISEVDEDCWFGGGGGAPTVRAVTQHARSMMQADPTLPVILASDGQVLDGMHRIARALLDGRPTVPAQRLPADPEPDWLRTDDRAH